MGKRERETEIGRWEKSEGKGGEKEREKYISTKEKEKKNKTKERGVFCLFDEEKGNSRLEKVS